MEINTRVFGKVIIDDEKLVIFENGIIGFEDLKTFAIIYDNEKDKNILSWLQSVDEPTVAIPVIQPFLVKQDYNPTVSEEFLKTLGDDAPEGYFILTTLKVPFDIRNMTADLKAPIIINVATKKACQIILENEEYPINFNVYNVLNNKKVGE